MLGAEFKQKIVVRRGIISMKTKNNSTQNCFGCGGERPSVFVFFLITLVLMCFFETLSALDDSLKKLLRDSTGVTDDDVKSATGKKGISLFDAYALAVQKTERMAIEGENSIQAGERKLQAIETFLPQFSLRANKSFPKIGQSLYSLSRSSASLYLRQPIMTGLKEVSKIKSAWSDRKIKEFQLYNTAGLLLGDVGSAYYSVLLIERDLKNNEQLLELYFKTVGELKRRVDIGRSRQSEILRTNAQIYTLQAQIKSLRTNLEHARLVLGTLIGIESEYNLVDTISLSDPAYSLEDMSKIVDARWDVKTAKEQVEYAKSGVLTAYGLHLPSLYIEGSYFLYQDQLSTPRWQSALQTAINPSAALANSVSGVSYKARNYYVSLGAELPIFGGDITFAKVREANSIKRQSDLGLSQTIRYARQDVIDSFQVWESSKIELDAYRKALASAEENYRVVTGEYRLNLVTILDVLTTLTSLQNAKDDYERAALQFKLNRLKVGIATNEFSGDKIRALKQ